MNPQPFELKNTDLTLFKPIIKHFLQKKIMLINIKARIK